MAEFKPFKVVKHDKYFFNEYWFHCTECGAEYYRNRFDSRTRTICSKCSAERDKLKAKERAERKEKVIRAKAIDDFAREIKSTFFFTDYMKELCFKDKIDEIAEQLKGE